MTTTSNPEGLDIEAPVVFIEDSVPGNMADSISLEVGASGIAAGWYRLVRISGDEGHVVWARQEDAAEAGR